jgi:NAD(P)-dependent dehydrogenase (short-subunit alcohol dehydrogenase family)
VTRDAEHDRTRGVGTLEDSRAVLGDRRIVVTGAARGLGRALAWQFARAGARPLLLGRDADALATTAAAVGGEAFAGEFDDLDGLAATAAAILARDPVVDAVVHNASPWLAGRIEDVSPEDAAAALRVAVAAPLALTRALLPGLRRAASPRIVVVVSRVALPGEAAHPVAAAAFTASKHGQAGLAEALRAELRSEGIAVTALFPPDFDDVQPEDAAWDAPGGERPTNRDIADAALFALSAPDRAPIDAIVVAQGAPHPQQAA